MQTDAGDTASGQLSSSTLTCKLAGLMPGRRLTRGQLRVKLPSAMRVAVMPNGGFRGRHTCTQLLKMATLHAQAWSTSGSLRRMVPKPSMPHSALSSGRLKTPKWPQLQTAAQMSFQCLSRAAGLQNLSVLIPAS